MAKNKRGRDAGRGSDMSKLYLGLIVVAVLAVGVVGYSMLGAAGVAGSAAMGPVDVEGLDDPSLLVQMAQGMTLGNPDADITIVEFGDFQCPGCGAFATQVKPRLDLAYIQTGEAKLVFYDFPLVQVHAYAFLAARSSRCAHDAGKYWEYHNALFQNQATWSGSSSPIGLFVDYAKGVGIDGDSFESCVRSDRHADLVTANMRLGQELGVGGTPSIMVQKGQATAVRVPTFDFESIRLAIEGLKGEGGN